MIQEAMTQATTQAHGIDHLVLPVHDLDQAIAHYARLGFTLTPKARHPFGTGNALVQLQGAFLELLAVVAPEDIHEATPSSFSFPAFNRDFLDEVGEGFSMLVLESHDSKGDRAAFLAAGLHAYDHYGFERLAKQPDGQEVTVGFSMAFLTHPAIPQAAFFTCQQLAPQYFWKTQYQTHANGARSVKEVTLVAEDPLSLKDFFTAMSPHYKVHAQGQVLTVATPRGAIIVQRPQDFARRYGVAEPQLSQGPRFMGYVISVADRKEAASVLRTNKVESQDVEAGLLVDPTLTHNTAIIFD